MGWNCVSVALSNRGGGGPFAILQRRTDMALDETSLMASAKVWQFVGIGAGTKRPAPGRWPCYAWASGVELTIEWE